MAMNEKYVQDFLEQADPGYVAPKSPAPVIPLPKQKVKEKSKPFKLAWTRSEKILCLVMGLVIFALCIYTISTSNRVSQLNQNLQDVQSQISEIEIANENLEQNVKELSQYERVLKIAEDQGLSLNDKNVRNIKK